MTQTATGAFESDFGGSAGPVNAGSDQSSQRSHGCGHWKGRHSRTRWSALEIGAMVGGFIVFWPLGLVALFLKWKNKEMWPGAADGTLPFSGLFSKKPSMPQGAFNGFGFGGFAGPSSGNSAFDSYKRQQLDRLEEERRKLDEEQREFYAYMKRLAEARDKDEFDRFMAERNAPKPASE